MSVSATTMPVIGTGVVPLPNTSADAGAVTVATSLAGTVWIQN